MTTFADRADPGGRTAADLDGTTAADQADPAGTTTGRVDPGGTATGRAVLNKAGSSFL
jgi:hypothetical protein